MAIDVTPVRGPGDLRAFVDLPFRLHAGTVWIPPLRLERYLFLTRKLNAYFSHGEAQYFLARSGGRVVGRVTAQVDHAYNAFHESRTGMFGFLDFEEDPEILEALLAAARDWLRGHGADEMIGPMDFQLNDESGILIEGFEHEPLIRQAWHPPYYQRLCEQVGLAKAMDLLSWDLDVGDRARMDPRLPSVAQRAHERYGVTIRHMERRTLRRDLDEFAKVYNAAWSHNWGFVPYSKADLDAYALDLQLVFSAEWFMVAEIDGETVGMAITIPDVNQVLQRMRGRLLPTGWLAYLRRWRVIDRLRVGFLGVMPEYEHTGIAAALYLEHFNVATRSRQAKGEAGFILETNTAMNRGLELMGGEVIKRWRVYRSAL